MIKKLALSLLLISSTALAHLEYRYERDLIEVFEDMDNYSFEEKCAITNDALKWLKTIIDENATGRRTVTKKDEKYLQRISWMVATIYNNCEYMGCTCHD